MANREVLGSLAYDRERGDSILRIPAGSAASKFSCWNSFGSLECMCVHAHTHTKRPGETGGGGNLVPQWNHTENVDLEPV